MNIPYVATVTHAMETMTGPEAPLSALSCDALRAKCLLLGLDVKGPKAQLVARIEAELAAIAAWDALCANPPTYPDGYRVIFDGDVEVALALDPHPLPGKDRIMFVRCRYTLPTEVTGERRPRHEVVTAATEDDVIWTARRNIGANYAISEFLRPGQRSRAELAADVGASRETTQGPDAGQRKALVHALREAAAVEESP